MMELVTVTVDGRMEKGVRGRCTSGRKRWFKGVALADGKRWFEGIAQGRHVQWTKMERGLSAMDKAKRA